MAVVRLPSLGLCLMLLAPIAAAAPTQVHLSQTGSTVTVQWALVGDTRSQPAGRVDFGATAVYSGQANGEMVGYVDATPYIGFSSAHLQRDLAEAAATLYRAQITNVLPGSTFHYRVVDGSGAASADFTAMALPGATAPLKFLVYGDQGTIEDGTLGSPQYEPYEVVNLSLAQSPQLVIGAGDLPYSEDGGLRYWNQWFDIIQPLAATRPYFAAVGNHDRDFVVGYDHWYKRFSFARDEQNYGFDAGPVHFLVLNSQEACLEGISTETIQRVNPNCQAAGSGAPTENTAITDFIKSDLADARARGVPWIVAVFHHPPYSNGGYNESNSGSSYMWWIRDHWLPLFEQYGVDMVMSGHDHDYERTWPMLHNATTTTTGTKFRENEGIIYVVTGGGGRNTYTLGADTPSWMAKGVRAHHVTIVEATTMKLKITVKTVAGTTIDAFEVRKAASQNGLPAILALAAIAGMVARRVRAR